MTFFDTQAFEACANSVRLFGAEYGSWGYEEGKSELKQSQSRHRETTRK
jgi:hypothetical protein